MAQSLGALVASLRNNVVSTPSSPPLELRDDSVELVNSAQVVSSQQPSLVAAYSSEQSASDSDDAESGSEERASSALAEGAVDDALLQDVTLSVQKLVARVDLQEQTEAFHSAFPSRPLSRSASVGGGCFGLAYFDQFNVIHRVGSAGNFFSSMQNSQDMLLTDFLLDEFPSRSASLDPLAGMESIDQAVSPWRALTPDDESDDGIQILYSPAPAPTAEVVERPLGEGDQVPVGDHVDARDADVSPSSGALLAQSALLVMGAPSGDLVVEDQTLDVTDEETSVMTARSSHQQAQSVDGIALGESTAPCIVPLQRLPTSSKELRRIARRAHAADISRRLGAGALRTAAPLEDAAAESNTRRVTRPNHGGASRKSCSKTSTASAAPQSKLKTTVSSQSVVPQRRSTQSAATANRRDGHDSRKRRRAADSEQLADESSKASSSRGRPPPAKRAKRRPATPEEQSSSSESSASDAPSSGTDQQKKKPRKKGDVETRARELLMQQPDGLFPEADLVAAAVEAEGGNKKARRSANDTRPRSKTIPIAYVPPRAEHDRQRPMMSKKALRQIAREFVLDSKSVLRLDEYKHFERLVIIRILLPLAFSGSRNPQPLIRLIRQNDRAVNDPISSLAATLIPALIDTTHSTQANSAQLTVFYYLLPLFMQRWGLMGAGTASQVQWRSVGLTLNNWNTYGRWPEMLIAAPREVAAFARQLFTGAVEVPPSAFQSALAELFVNAPAPLARWCFIRRCSKAVNVDITGQSLGVDLIVPPLAVWLRSVSPARVAVACASADALALAPDPADRVDYPSPDVYQVAMTTLTEFLAGASSSVAYERLVQKTVSQNAATLSDQILDYTGTDPAILAAVQTFADDPPGSVEAFLSSTEAALPSLSLAFRWPSSAENPVENEPVLRVTVPLAEWESMRDALLARGAETSDAPGMELPQGSSCSAIRDDASSVEVTNSSLTTPVARSNEISDGPIHATDEHESPLLLDANARYVHISGLRGSVTDETLRGVLSKFGELQELTYAEDAGKLCAHFKTAAGAMRAVLGIYSTITRAENVHAIVKSTPAPAVPSASSRRRSTVASASGTRVFGGAPASLDLATSFLLARPPLGMTLHSTNNAITAVIEKGRAQQEQLLAKLDPPVSETPPERRQVLRTGAVYDITESQAQFRAVLSGEVADVSVALLATLRQIVVDHLRANPSDSVYVTPPEWLEIDSGVSSAAQPGELLNGDGEVVNVSRARVLLCPYVVGGLPGLIVVAFPASLDVLAVKFVPPFVVVLGATLSPALEHKLLVFLFVRLEALLETRTAITRPSVATLKVTRSTTRERDGSLGETILRLAHAAHILLQLVSSTECLPFHAAFFTAPEVLDTFATSLKTRFDISQDREHEDNPALTRQAQLLEQWRALAAHVKTSKPMSWRHTMTAAAYTSYTAHRYLRAQEDKEWASSKRVAELVATENVKRGYELILCELHEAAAVEERAFCARLQQLYQRGWYVLGADGKTIDVCRKATEHGQLHLTDFTLTKDGLTYFDQEERHGQKVGWGGPPSADY